MDFADRLVFELFSYNPQPAQQAALAPDTPARASLPSVETVVLQEDGGESVETLLTATPTSTVDDGRTHNNGERSADGSDLLNELLF